MTCEYGAGFPANVAALLPEQAAFMRGKCGHPDPEKAACPSGGCEMKAQGTTGLRRGLSTQCTPGEVQEVDVR